MDIIYSVESEYSLLVLYGVKQCNRVNESAIRETISWFGVQFRFIHVLCSCWTALAILFLYGFILPNDKSVLFDEQNSVYAYMNVNPLTICEAHFCAVSNTQVSLSLSLSSLYIFQPFCFSLKPAVKLSYWWFTRNCSVFTIFHTQLVELICRKTESNLYFLTSSVVVRREFQPHIFRFLPLSQGFYYIHFFSPFSVV